MAAADVVTPFHSYNATITAKADITTKPSPEELEEMRKTDPALESEWTIWEQIVPPKDSKTGYADATRKTGAFSTFKTFWAYWNHLPQPSELLNGKKFMREEGNTRTIVDCLMIFRKGIRPEWEAEANAYGGHFQVMMKPEVGGGLIDEVWNNIVTGMICNSFKNADMITGVRLVDKLTQKTKPGPNIRIEVWFDDLSDEDKLYDLKGAFEECIRTQLDGVRRKATWGYTEMKAHSK